MTDWNTNITVLLTKLRFSISSSDVDLIGGYRLAAVIDRVQASLDVRGREKIDE